MIIGLSGYARSGKDTVAEILVLNHGFKRLAFADNIRKAIIRLDPILENGKRISDMVDEYGWEIAKSYEEARRLLQVFGTEIGRDMFGQNFWVEQVFEEMNLYPMYDNFVISDVRFPNEADMIAWNQGEVWRINRSSVSPINSHPSELALDEYSFTRTLSNDGTIENLSREVSSILRGSDANISI